MRHTLETAPLGMMGIIQQIHTLLMMAIPAEREEKRDL